MSVRIISHDPLPSQEGPVDFGIVVIPFWKQIMLSIVCMVEICAIIISAGLLVRTKYTLSAKIVRGVSFIVLAPFLVWAYIIIGHPLNPILFWVPVVVIAAIWVHVVTESILSIYNNHPMPMYVRKDYPSVYYGIVTMFSINVFVVWFFHQYLFGDTEATITMKRRFGGISVPKGASKDPNGPASSIDLSKVTWSLVAKDVPERRITINIQSAQPIPKNDPQKLPMLPNMTIYAHERFTISNIISVYESFVHTYTYNRLLRTLRKQYSDTRNSQQFARRLIQPKASDNEAKLIDAYFAKHKLQDMSWTIKLSTQEYNNERYDRHKVDIRLQDIMQRIEETDITKPLNMFAYFKKTLPAIQPLAAKNEPAAASPSPDISPTPPKSPTPALAANWIVRPYQNFTQQQIDDLSTRIGFDASLITSKYMKLEIETNIKPSLHPYIPYLPMMAPWYSIEATVKDLYSFYKQYAAPYMLNYSILVDQEDELWNLQDYNEYSKLFQKAPIHQSQPNIEQIMEDLNMDSTNRIIFSTETGKEVYQGSIKLYDILKEEPSARQLTLRATIREIEDDTHLKEGKSPSLDIMNLPNVSPH